MDKQLKSNNTQKEKISDYIIKPLKLEKKATLKTNALGMEGFNNIYLIAEKDTGKTTVVYHILDELVDEDTYVIIFAGRVYQDATYKEIIKNLIKKKIPYIIENSFMDADGKNQLKALTKKLKENNSEEWLELDPFLITDSENSERDEFLKPHEKLIIVIDDLSEEIRKSKDLESLLKANRHTNTTIIVSTQSKNDLPPGCIGQMQYILAFPRIPCNKKTNKIFELYENINPPISYDKFEELYKDATEPNNPGEKSRNFLLIDRNNNKFRKNFNLLYNI